MIKPALENRARLRGTPACSTSCPAGVKVHGYIALINKGQYDEALSLIRRDNPFPSVCAWVCTKPCENACERGNVDEPLAIRELKRFLYVRCKDHEEHVLEEVAKKDYRIAIIGAGPAGLTAAYFLAKRGYEVTIFDANDRLGGTLITGVPPFRLPREAIENDIAYIMKANNINFVPNFILGKDFTLQDLLNTGYSAIFIAIGAHKGLKLGIDGEELDGVLDGIEFLKSVNLKGHVEIGERVVVIGGGNSAIDAARTAIRLGAKDVTVIYRRSRFEMPAYPEEVERAEEEGVKLMFLTSPKKFIGRNGRLIGIECIKMRLAEPDESGRRRPIPIPGSEFYIGADTAIVAIGEAVDSDLIRNMGIEVTEKGTIKVDPETLMTNIAGVFAGGDCVRGPSTIIEAIADGKLAAEMIDRYLQNLPLKHTITYEGRVARLTDEERKKVARCPRLVKPIIKFSEDLFDIEEVYYDEEDVRKEASRCLKCWMLKDMF